MRKRRVRLSTPFGVSVTDGASSMRKFPFLLCYHLFCYILATTRGRIDFRLSIRDRDNVEDSSFLWFEWPLDGACTQYIISTFIYNVCPYFTSQIVPAAKVMIGPRFVNVEAAGYHYRRHHHPVLS